MIDSKIFAGTGVRLIGRNLSTVRVDLDFFSGLISEVHQMSGYA